MGPVSKEVWIWVSKETEITFGVWTPLMGPVRPLYFASCVYQHENLQSLFFFSKIKNEITLNLF